MPESEFLRFAQVVLDFELRKKFEGMVFQDLYELTERAIRFETILKEENIRKNTLLETYYQKVAVIEPREQRLSEIQDSSPLEIDVAKYV